MAVGNIAHRAAIRNHVAFEIPLTAQLIFKQKLAGASRLPVEAVVGAHHTAGLGLSHRGAKCREISVKLIVLADLDVGGVARGLRSRVHGVVLGRRDHAIVTRIVALHAGDKRHTHARREEWIFAVRLLAAPPARVAEDVDIRRPEIEAVKNDAVAVRIHGLRVHYARLDADVGGHLVNARGIEGRGQCDGLGKFRGSACCHAVQRLAPPVVGRHAQPRNGARLVHQLAGLLFERHLLHQVGRALLRRQIRIQVRGFSGVLRPQCAHRAQPQQSSSHHSHSKHRHRLPHCAVFGPRTPCIRRRPTLIAVTFSVNRVGS